MEHAVNHNLQRATDSNPSSRWRQLIFTFRFKFLFSHLLLLLACLSLNTSHAVRRGTKEPTPTFTRLVCAMWDRRQLNGRIAAVRISLWLSELQVHNFVCLPVNTAVRSLSLRAITCDRPGRHSLGTATCCGLDGSEIESRWGRHFSHPSSPDNPDSYKIGIGSLSRG